MAIIDESIIEDLKKNDYEFAEIIGVECVGKSSRIICKCECGKIFKKKLYQMKSLTINCGCKKSLLLSRAFYKKVESDPTFLKRRGEAYSKWCKEHQDEVKIKGKQHSEKLLSNPEKLAEQGKQHSQWYKDNPDKNKELSEKKSKWYKENQDKVKSRSEKYSKWCKENPEKVKEKALKYSKWCKENPSNKELRDLSILNIKKEKRIDYLNTFSKDDLAYIHPDDLKLLLAGELSNKMQIRIKCSNCDNYISSYVGNILSFKNGIVNNRLCNNCRTTFYRSHYEDELYDFIVSLGVQCIKNDRTIIPPKEVDLYIPSRNLAIEFNGTFWHNEDVKGKYYHYDKFLECLNKGIRLISIYEYDYNIPEKKCKILNCIKDAIVKTDRVYARLCSVCNISNECKKEFFNLYHIDGDSRQGSISYGLFFNNQLVSCISFGKLRGQNSLRNKEGYYELVRYATLPQLTIIGGLSKMLKCFITQFNPKNIICYSDNDYFSGNGYSKVGFSLVSRGRSAIDYNWVKDDIVLSRQQCMVHRLLKSYPQYSNIEIDGSKEKYIMNDLNFYRIFRCGNSKWELNI